MTIIEAAKDAAQYFTTTERNDDTIVVLKDPHPQWVEDMAHDAHGDYLPDDWRYQFIREAVDAIADADEDVDLDELLNEFGQDFDIYTGKLTSWLGSRASRTGYVDEAVEEFGHADSITGDLQNGQMKEREEVFAAIRRALESHIEEAEEE